MAVCFACASDHCCIPFGSRLLFVGDSTMRYQWIALAHALRHGKLWTQDAPVSIVNERTFNNSWRDFFHYTTADLAPFGHCDCFRDGTATQTFENRYFELPPPFNITLALFYVGPSQNSLHGHWLAGDGNERRQIVTGLRPSSTRFHGSLHSMLRANVPALQPTHVIVNVGLQLDANLSPRLLHAINVTLAASRVAAEQRVGHPLPFVTVWKTMSPTDWSRRAYFHLKHVIDGLSQNNYTSEREMAAPHFDLVHDATALLEPLTNGSTWRPGMASRPPAALQRPAVWWDSVVSGCIVGCNGVHLVAKGNNLLITALLRQLWPDWHTPEQRACRWRPLDAAARIRLVDTGAGTVVPPEHGWPPLLVCTERSTT